MNPLFERLYYIGVRDSKAVACSRVACVLQQQQSCFLANIRSLWYLFLHVYLRGIYLHRSSSTLSNSWMHFFFNIITLPSVCLFVFQHKNNNIFLHICI